ncbi:DUF6503 family protein [uncultured Tenacibaculum sp.]|uniref:DUF6503 family protein n=1 Tax=uncultured Tenacibaculum sp. TaxID=174713 RepID=UPI00262E6BBE|nr:DUF6503 family protein [uncultured Tenacibaculum sp.]
MKKLLILFISILSVQSYAQELTGKQLLDKAIQYHDPNGNWDTFKGTLLVTMETPKSPNRDSEIQINLPEEYFYVKASRGENTTEYTIDKDACRIGFNGQENPSEAILKEHKLSCDRAKLYKNYYTYLYGLPMKLKDQGTIIHDKVTRKTFKGKEYLVLKVTYDQKVGSDTWYFYFNPETYAMEVYQFFKEKPTSGEYILLSDKVTVNGIKMPKNRAWYYNKNDGYLGTDILKNK